MLKSLMISMSENVGRRPFGTALRQRSSIAQVAQVVQVAPSTPSNATELIASELGRARRHERPFSILSIPLGLAGGPPPHDTARLIPSVLRECDRMVIADGCISVLLPETDSVGAQRVVDRLSAVTALDAHAVHRASFPCDGVTSGALGAVLSGRPRLAPDAGDLPLLVDRPYLRELAS